MAGGPAWVPEPGGGRAEAHLATVTVAGRAGLDALKHDLLTRG